MGLTTLIGLWMIVQNPRPQGGIQEPQAVAYYFDKNECLLIAASNERWECKQRPDIDKVKARKNKTAEKF